MAEFDEFVEKIKKINPDCYIDPSLKSRFNDHQGYIERSRIQSLNWAMGRVYHNEIDDECTVDFSCCIPELFTKDADGRWKYYDSRYGPNSDYRRDKQGSD